MNEKTAQIDVNHSRPLDVHLWSDYAEINDLVKSIFDSFSSEEKLQIKGRSNNRGRASGFTHLKVLLIDLYVAWRTDPSLCIGVARGNGAHTVNTRYNALFISPRIRDVIDLLIANDYLDSIGGSYDRIGNGRRNHTSRIRASDKLCEAFEGLTIEPYQLSLNHKQECIVLTKDDTDEEGNPIKLVRGRRTVKKRVRVEYKDSDNPSLQLMRSDLQQYNELLCQTYVDIPSLQEPFIERQLKNGRTQKLQINQTKKFVRRIFSRDDWEMNGRFYGGFWQQIGKNFRKQIYINDSPTIEVDYKGLHAAILSARKGVVSDTDRYDLGLRILTDFDQKQQRDVVKMLVLTAINAKSPKSVFSAFRDSQKDGSRKKRLTDSQLKSLLEAFINKHPYLEDDICSDKGIELMYTDSQITAHIIKKFCDLNKPILTIHDSYIVGTRDTELLRRAMKQATIKVVGVDLSVEQEGISYQQIMSIQQQDRNRYLDTFKEVLVNQVKTERYQENLSKFIEYHSRELL